MSPASSRTSEPPFPVGTSCPSPEAATIPSLAPLEVCVLQRDVPPFSSASPTPPPVSSPTCFPFLTPLLSFQYKLQSHIEFILMRHYCLSFWISRRLQSNAKDTLITKGVSQLLHENTQNIIKTNCYQCKRKLPVHGLVRQVLASPGSELHRLKGKSRVWDFGFF